MVGQTIFKEIRRLFNFNQFKDYEEEKSIHGRREDADSAGSRTKWHVSNLPEVRDSAKSLLSLEEQV
jgi:hypothetical protein